MLNRPFVQHTIFKQLFFVFTSKLLIKRHMCCFMYPHAFLPFFFFFQINTITYVVFNTKFWQASIDSLVGFSLQPTKLKELLTMELITASSLTQAWISLLSLQTLISFLSNWISVAFPEQINISLSLLTSFVYIFLYNCLYLNQCGDGRVLQVIFHWT